jgi:hypothetical protein
MPEALQHEIAEIEQWAESNSRDERNDNLKFWALKIPAILVSASSGLFAFFQWKVAGLIGGAIAGACVAIDGALRAGTLRGVHRRAVFDLRMLEEDIHSEWRTASLRKEFDPREVAAELIASAQKRKRVVAEYLRAAETGQAKNYSSH